MADREVVIKISEGIIEYVKNNDCLAVCFADDIAKAIKNGTQLPAGHGRLKDIDKIEKLLDLEKPNNVIAEAIKNIIDSVPTIIGTDYAGLEEKHLGSPENKTGIYADDIDTPKTVGSRI